MKISIILPSLQQSGPGIQVANIVAPLINLGAEIEIFYLRKVTGEKLNFDKVKCHQVDLFNLKGQFDRFDIIHSNGFYPDLIASLVGIQCGKLKIVSSLHNFIYEDFRNRYGVIKGKCFALLWFLVLRFIQNKFVFTKIAKDYYQERTSGNIFVAGSGVPVNDIINLRFNEEDIPDNVVKDIIAMKNNGFKVIGSTSIISRVKGLDVVVKALVSLSNHIAVFVGGGPSQKEIQDLGIELGVSDRMIFLGFQKNPIYYMQFFDVFAMPSLSESFGLSLFEAIACRVPIVCSSLPVFKEILNDSDVCFFNGSPEGFVAAVKQSHENNHTESAYNSLLEKYDIDVISKEYYKLYNELILK